MDATIANVVLSSGGETHLPVGPLSVVTTFERAGWGVDFRDYQLAGIDTPFCVDSLVRFLDTPAPVLGVSCYFNLLPLVVLALEEIRRCDPEKVLLLGGPGPSELPARLMETYQAIDIIVRGEGEETVDELLPALARQRANAGEDLDRVAGITFRRNGAVVTTPQRGRIRHIDDLPLPAYHATDLSAYTGLAVTTARGCPFGCRFCQVAPLWGRITRSRDLDQVVNEIAMLCEGSGVDELRIADDTLTLNRKRVLGFAARMKQRLPHVRWSCLGRIDLVDEELLAAMAEGGCIGIQYGVESGSQEVLKRVAKPYSTPEICEAVRFSVQFMEHVVCTFIWGFPFETMEQFYMTFNLMGRVAELGADIKLLCLMPLPLSSLYDEFGDDLAFNPEIAAHSIDSGHGAGEEDGHDLDRLLAMIRRHPGIFPDFYHYASDIFERKLELVRNLRLL